MRNAALIVIADTAATVSRAHAATAVRVLTAVTAAATSTLSKFTAATEPLVGVTTLSAVEAMAGQLLGAAIEAIRRIEVIGDSTSER